MKRKQPAEWKIGTSFSPASSTTLKEIKEAGLDSIELVISRNEPVLTLKGLRRVYNPYIEEAHDLGLEVWSIHFPFGVDWDISTIELNKRKEILEYHEAWLTWVSEWEIKNVIIHPSYEPIIKEDRDERIIACKDSLYKLAEKGQLLDIHICVEDLPRTCLGNTSQEMNTIIHDHDNLWVCCDVNHLLLETPESFIKALGPSIRSVHISDYDGVDERHWLPGSGIIKWTEVIGALTDSGYEGPFMFEVGLEKEKLNPRHLVSCWKDLLKAYEEKK